MHERSLVKTLLTQVDAVRRQQGAERVTEVRVEVGPLSGVEPLLLATAFAELATASTVAGATLVVDEVPLLAECQPCGRQFEVNDYVFRCPICRGNVQVTSGDGFQLVSVSLEVFQPTQELAS